MPYAKLEPTGCGIHKGRIKLRLDFFLNPDDPNYDKHHIYVPVIPEEGYLGKVEVDGSPTNQKDYEVWLDSLPHIWRNNPFHSHFIYPDKNASNTDVKAEMERVLNYFYAFHQHCWNTEQQFCGKDKDGKVVGLWERVPSQVGQVRCPFIKGDSKDFTANQSKVQNILSRVQEFQVDVSKVLPRDLNIGEKGTIDVGSSAIDRDLNVAISGSSYVHTLVTRTNPANTEGEIDTIEIYCGYANAGNVLRVGSFKETASNNFKCHDGYEIGQASVGYNEFTGVALDITEGEFIGCDGKQAGYLLTVDQGSSGGSGIHLKEDFAGCDPDDTFLQVLDTSRILSLYGTGTGAGGEENHRRGSFFKMF